MARIRSTAATVGLIAITTVCPERRKRKMSDYLVPKFVVKGERNDVTTQVRVQQIANGYVVKAGDKPIHYSTIEESAEAVKRGLIKAFCEEQRSSICKSS
jgi:hypothetical protein